jgi:phosphatidylserine/phosphatidylglycerophosphate/cardiolipin synthase-like enzyme
LFAGMNPKKLRVYTMFKRFIHSKFILIEDRALSLGSANANPRSFQLDSELNVLLEDAEAVRKFRLRLWAHDLGDSESNIAGWAVSDFIAKWDAVAKANQKLISKPDDMTGEGVIPFDYKTIPGRKNAIPDVLTELPFGERVTFPEEFEF